MSIKRQKIPDRYPASQLELEGEAQRQRAGGIEMLRTENETESPASTQNLMEEVIEASNWQKAVRQVIKNKGAPGIDGMKVQRLTAYLERHERELHARLLEGSYQPQPVRPVQIPKPAGGTRQLGIPVVLDRCVLQALMQVLQKRWDPTFSEFSFGFRPGRSAHQAIALAQKYIEEGYGWVVDIDLEKFFDRVNHDKLMGTIAQRVQDKRVLKLIRAFLNAGILQDGLVQATEEGVPQGAPLSPLLSNLVLDELDRELQKRGLRFVRFADDCNIYVRSERAGERVMKSIKDFISRKLKLKVNESKSAVDKPLNRKFLSFSFTAGKQPRRRIAVPALDKFKRRVRELTDRGWSVSFQTMTKDLKSYLHGWIAYFGFAEARSVLKELDGWTRRRLRSFLWQQWKTPRKRFKELRKRGVPYQSARDAAGSSRGPWRMSLSPALHQALPKTFFDSLKIPSLFSSVVGA